LIKLDAVLRRFFIARVVSKPSEFNDLFPVVILCLPNDHGKLPHLNSSFIESEFTGTTTLRLSPPILVIHSIPFISVIDTGGGLAMAGNEKNKQNKMPAKNIIFTLFIRHLSVID